VGTSGTGHDRCPSQKTGPVWHPAATIDGDKKISKSNFGFKRSRNFFKAGCFSRASPFSE